MTRLLASRRTSREELIVVQNFHDELRPTVASQRKSP
jgi:hypothetical protein